jgi:purine-nucleoside phosphorylase
MLQQLQEAADYIKKIHHSTPTIGVILGSGLGNFTKEITVTHSIAYSEIPNFPVSTVQSHEGKLLFGRVAGKEIVAMSGRFHFYEGYTAQEVVFPVRVMKLLGVEKLLISNAAGAMNKNFEIGNLMIITDHISLFIDNPLVGKNLAEFGPRFPDMSEPYSKKMVAYAKKVALENNIAVTEGVYCSVTGPTFETKAEYKLLLASGGDAVGMSTVQETIAAKHAGMDVFAISVISDIGIMEVEQPITYEEVLQAVQIAEPKLTAIFKGLISLL